MPAQLNKTDPRVIRTRKLIQAAFLSLARGKDFNTITVRDITEKATINRATFYAHYSDKYVLIQSIISDKFMAFVSKRVKPQAQPTEETMRNLILSVCDYHDKLRNLCKPNNSIVPIIEMNVKEQLEDIIASLLTKNINSTDNEKRSIGILATMISCSICGAVYDWHMKEPLTTSSVFTEEILPFIMAGGYAKRCEDIKHS